MDLDNVKKARARMEAWPIATMSPEDQKASISTELGDRLLSFFMMNDVVEDVYVLEGPLANIITEVISTLPFNEELFFKDMKEDQAVALKADLPRVTAAWQKFVDSVIVRPVPIDVFSGEESFGLPEFDQFTRIMSRNAKVHAFLESWDREVGLTKTMASRGCPFTLSTDQKALLFGFFSLMESAQSAAVNHSLDEEQIKKAMRGIEI